MGAGYTTLIVSDRQDDITDIKSKLNVSRTMDTIVNCTLDRAVEFCRKYFPDVLIVFAHNKSNELFEVCKIVKLDSLLKHIPIIFIFDEFDKDFILESLNVGISDYIIAPIKKTDILAHLVWAFKKSALIRELEIKETLLKDLGVVDRNTGAYLPKFIPVGFTSHINIAKKYKYPVIFMAIHIDSPFKNNFNSDYLVKVLQKTLRTSDVVGQVELGRFFVLLPKTDLKGTYAVHNKIVKNLGDNFTISVGVCMSSGEENFQILSDFAVKALSEAIANGGNRILVYNHEQIKTELKNINEKQIQDRNEAVESGAKVTSHWLNKVQLSKNSYDSFKKEFMKKVNNIISPCFYKMRDNLKVKYPTSVIIDYSSTDTKCEFSVKEVYAGTENVLQIVDPGLSYIKIERNLKKAGKQTVTRYNIELDDLTETYIERILQDVFNEFEIVSDIEKLSKNVSW